MPERPNRELLAAAAAGDSQAWSLIVRRFERLVWSVVRVYRLDDAAAGDVCQTVWLRLVENCDRIRDPERLAAWLATTARNEALRTVRLQRRTVPSDFEFDLIDGSLPDPDAALIREEETDRMVVAFGGLSEDCRRLLRLLVADPPLDYDTISELIGRPKGSIGPTRGRCLDKLRKIIARHDRGDSDEKGPVT